MPIAISVRFSGGDAQLDENLRRAFVPGGGFPAGGLLRLAGPVDGGWRVFSVWESKERWESFRSEKLLPMLQRLGIQAEVELWTLTNMMFASDRLENYSADYGVEAPPPTM